MIQRLKPGQLVILQHDDDVFTFFLALDYRDSFEVQYMIISNNTLDHKFLTEFGTCLGISFSRSAPNTKIIYASKQ